MNLEPLEPRTLLSGAPGWDGPLSEVAAGGTLEPAPLGSDPAPLASPLIVDHNDTDITAIPLSAIEKAKGTLHVAYGHTSHGSQVTDGMSGLVDFANGGGLGLSHPPDTFAWNNGGSGGALDLHDYAMGGDCGYYPDWVDNTRAYLDNPGNSDVNVIVWSWCGQVDEKYAAGTLEGEYLAPMSQLEADYAEVTFVYMTGHVDHWDDANNKAANAMVRDYCTVNNKVLYDFADIESYDPDGVYFEFPNDNCDYYASADGSLLGNWATEWQDSHTEGVDWYACSSAHSQPLNANRKAYAAWSLWTQIAARMEPPEDLDVDANGRPDALSDGIVMIRYIFGFRGAALVEDALPPDAVRTDPAEIAAMLDTCRDTMLDVDSSGEPDALTDGILILRYLFGFTGDALVEDAIGSDATRTDPGEIAVFLQQFDPNVQVGPTMASSQTLVSGKAEQMAIAGPLGVVERSGAAPAGPDGPQPVDVASGKFDPPPRAVDGVLGSQGVSGDFLDPLLDDPVLFASGRKRKERSTTDLLREELYANLPHEILPDHRQASIFN